MRPQVQPDATGFGDAMDRKRAVLGSPVTFLWDAQITFPPEIPVNPQTGKPFDPLAASAGTGAQASASAVCAVFFKAINRGGASNADEAAAFGHDEKTRCFVNLASADGLVISGQASAWAGAPFAGFGSAASEFVFHGNRFKIYAQKEDEIITGYRRTLVYGAGIGADSSSGFEP